MKKVAVLAIFVLAIISLASCRSKKSSCTKADIQKNLNQPQETVDVACIEVE